MASDGVGLARQIREKWRTMEAVMLASFHLRKFRRGLAGSIVCAGTVALLLLAPVTENHARDIGEIGMKNASTDRIFRSACRPDDVIIGFSIRSGTALDAIVPICIAVNPTRTDWSGEAYEPTPYQGGEGGGYQKIACSPGDAVRHFHVYAGPWGDKLILVKHVRMTCQDLNSGNWYNVVPSHIAGTVTIDERFSCGDDEWGTGIFGTYYKYVQKLGFACERLVAAPILKTPEHASDAVATPPAPTPTPTPQAPTCTVLLPVEVYDKPDGVGQKIGDLAAGAAGVTLVEPCRQNWCHIKGNSVPKGEGWSYSGPDYRSLNCQ